MATKKPNKNNRILLLIVLGILLFSGWVYYNFQTKNTTLVAQDQDNKTFSSSILKFSVDVPKNYQIEEKFTDVILTNNKADINISRTGTNFETVGEYIAELENKNSMVVTDKQSIASNIISGYINHSNGVQKKTYFIYAGNWAIYTLSTASKELYSDLDQIARSFKYTP